MLTVKELSFSYPQSKNTLLYPDFELHDGELLAIMGASGCGKSTLLHLIAGLLKPSSGEILSDHHKISYAFQEPRLFSWMTAAQNIQAVLPRNAEKKTVFEALHFVELLEAEALYPAQLSGGMKSRVSLARALAYNGDLFLLDEPFSALDETLHRALCQKLKRHLKETGASAILVTHALEDAQLFADRILTFS